MSSPAKALPAGFPGVAEFESLRFDPGTFSHQAHVYVGWLLVQESDVPVAAGRFTSALRRLVRKHGIEDKYHETISWFFMLLIAERQSLQQHVDWESFAAANPDLIAEPLTLLQAHYSTERLWSRLARRQFLLPDLTGSMN